MSSCKRVAFVAVILLTSISIVFYGTLHQNALHLINSIITSSSLRSHLSKISRDLSDEFKKYTAFNSDRSSVFETLKQDGYTPVAVSEVGGFGSLLESKNSCSSISERAIKVTSAPYNLSEVASNKSLVEGSGNNRSQPVDKQLNVTQVLKVPNVVHYVFLGSNFAFTFVNYLSYRSVDRFIRPDQIFVHGDHIPSGKWWNRTINEVKNIYHVNRTYSNKAPNGQPFRYPAHISDYMRTETLLNYGGIYLDLDVLVVMSFDPLRRFSFVIGRETSDRLCNGIMLAERGAPFLRLLLEQYHSYLGPKELYAEKSVLNADKLARLYPHLVHVEERTLNRPNWIERAQIYDGRYNWKQNYAVHLWVRMWPNEKRPNGVEDILTKKTTIAELARLSMCGSHEITEIFTNKTTS